MPSGNETPRAARRVELAALLRATWLEQGRNIAASEQVVDAPARALLLGPDQRRHQRGLAGLATAVGETQVGDVLPRLQRLVDAAAPEHRLHLRQVLRLRGVEHAVRFRAVVGQRPDDPRFATMVGELSEAGPEFRPVEHPDLLMVLQVPASKEDLRRVTSLLGGS